MSITAMKQALEALEKSLATCFDQYAHEQVMSRPEHFINQTLTTLRQAIEQAEKQEPVLWQWIDSEMVTPYDKTNVEGWAPLYTTPQPQREWVEQPVAWISRESLWRLKQGGNHAGVVPVHAKRSHTSCIPLYIKEQL